MVMPALIGGFLRRDTVYSKRKSFLSVNNKGSGLFRKALANEPGSLGLMNRLALLMLRDKARSVWRALITDAKLYRRSYSTATIPNSAERSGSLVTIQSLARAKCCMKVGPAIVVFPQLQILREHEDGKIRNRLSSVDPLLTSHTSTDSVLIQGRPSYIKINLCCRTLNTINRQPGNLVKTVDVNKFTLQTPETRNDLIASRLSWTLSLSKLWLDIVDWYGGKITEKAKALSNVKDRGVTRAKEIEATSDCSLVKALSSSKMIKFPVELSDNLVRLTPLHRSLWPNSVLSMRATNFSNLNIRCQRIHKSSLTTMKSETKLLWPSLKRLKIIADKVYVEQRKLVELAQQYGKNDRRVLRLQEALGLSFNFRIYSVYKVTINSGASTPGIDGITLTTPEEKALMVEKLREILCSKEYKASPVRRVYTWKDTKLAVIRRGSGSGSGSGYSASDCCAPPNKVLVPTVRDRCLQQVVKLILEPIVEMNSDLHSYAFRKYRGPLNAIGAARVSLRKNMQNKHILNATIEGFFDNIHYQWLKKNTPLPGFHKDLLNEWFRSGAILYDVTTDTDRSFQGIVSPILVNLTLNGLEKTVDHSLNKLTSSKERRISFCHKDGNKYRIALKVKVIRYADNLIIIARSKHLLKKYILPAVKKFLSERGLSLSSSKTRIINLQTDPLNFLGYTFRYRDKWKVGEKFYKSQINKDGIAVYPQKDKLQNIISKLRAITRNSSNLTGYQLVSIINPIIRGWSNYFNLGNSARYRDHLRQALYRLCWKWAQKKHPKWGKKTIAHKYFRSNTTFKNRTWVFHGITAKLSRYHSQGRNEGKKIYLVDPSNIVSSVCATKFNIPKNLLNIHAFHKDYLKILEYKSKTNLLSIGKYESYKSKLFKKQNGVCAVCKKIISIEDANIHHIIPISEGGNASRLTNMILIHLWCHKEIHFA